RDGQGPRSPHRRPPAPAPTAPGVPVATPCPPFPIAAWPFSRGIRLAVRWQDGLANRPARWTACQAILLARGRLLLPLSTFYGIRRTHIQTTHRPRRIRASPHERQAPS